jgi:hypothetical protein
MGCPTHPATPKRPTGAQRPVRCPRWPLATSAARATTRGSPSPTKRKVIERYAAEHDLRLARFSNAFRVA